jgi:hypothetical protein
MAKQFQRRRFLEINQPETRIADNIIKHSVKNHSLDVLKIKHLELNEKNGIYGYRSHNFNILPRELYSTGKKIETIYFSMIVHSF